MKALLSSLVCLFFIVCASCTSKKSLLVDAEKPISIVPWPASIQYLSSEFLVSEKTGICVEEEVAEVADQFQSMVKDFQGINLASRACDTNAIFFKLDVNLSDKGLESYVMDINTQGIVITAPQPAGLYYAAVSLAQMLSSRAEYSKEVLLPGLHIEDTPRYSWRGLMLDPARHFLVVDEVKKIIQQMAQLKMNRLHLHLTDDQGWRIEIKKYPRLTSVGAWRYPPSYPESANKREKPYGGFYTQEDIRDIVAYAASYHITVIPEIDMPGHAQAAVAAYPDIIGVTGDRPEVSHDWGINPYLFDTSDASMAFIKDVLDEVIALFPGQYIHLGGDEAIKDQWQASPEIKGQMQRLGVENAHKMQGWFMAELGEYLTQHGKRMIGWDEILEGGVPESASVMSWRGNAGTVEAVRLGHDVIQSSFYLDNLQSTRGDEPAGRLGFLSLSRVYNTNIMPAGLTPEERKHVLGAQGHLWSEYLMSPWYVQRAAFPRAVAIAEILWSQSSDLSWSSFLRRLPNQMQRFEQQGIVAADAAFAVNFGLKEGRNQAIKKGRAELVLSNQVDFGKIHYTLDGSEPNEHSTLYLKPIEIELNTQIKAITLDAQGRKLAATRHYDFSLSTLRTRDSSEFHTCYGGGFGLRMPLTADSPAAAPVYNSDIFHNCFVYPKASLDGVASVELQVAKLPRHYGLAHEAHKVKSYKKKSAFGDLVLYLDNCDSGKELTRVPLSDPKQGAIQESLVVSLPETTGVHNLCFIFAAPLSGPFYGVDSIELRPLH